MQDVDAWLSKFVSNCCLKCVIKVGQSQEHQYSYAPANSSVPENGQYYQKLAHQDVCYKFFITNPGFAVMVAIF